MEKAKKIREAKALAREFEEDLVRTHGHVIGGKALLALLGYPSPDALNVALKRSRVDVPVFELPYRRGKWALAKDIAQHLVARRNASVVLKSRTAKA